jgi:hypothetical protein
LQGVPTKYIKGKMSITTRNYKTTDKTDIISIQNACVDVSGNCVSNEYKLKEEHINKDVQGNQEYVLAENNGVIVGFGRYHKNKITMLCVSRAISQDDARKVFHYLVKELTSRIKKNGYKEVVSFIRDDASETLGLVSVYTHKERLRKEYKTLCYKYSYDCDAVITKATEVRNT